MIDKTQQTVARSAGNPYFFHTFIPGIILTVLNQLLEVKTFISDKRLMFSDSAWF